MSSKKSSISCCPLNLQWPLNLKAFRQKRSSQRSEFVKQVRQNSKNVFDDGIEFKSRSARPKSTKSRSTRTRGQHPGGGMTLARVSRTSAPSSMLEVRFRAGPVRSSKGLDFRRRRYTEDWWKNLENKVV